MVTKTFLSILTLGRGQVPSTIDTVRRRRTIVLCSSSTKYTYIVATQILYSGYILWSQTPPYYPQKGKKNKHPTFLAQTKPPPPSSGKEQYGQKDYKQTLGEAIFSICGTVANGGGIFLVYGKWRGVGI